jgi:type 1 glutamine amidotransferase
MDGGGGHPVNNQLQQLAPLMDKGVGLMCMHYAVEVPVGPTADAFKKWIGGYYESGWSINPHWDAQSILAKGHPITRGVNPFTLRDEWYYNMRWHDDSASVTPILQAIPGKEARSGSTSSPRGPKKHIVEAEGRTETLMWAVQRPDGGRGVGFTGGHFHKNWADEGQRKLVLNAILWVANIEVPAAGVQSKVTDEQMAANLDVKQPRKAAPKKK